MPEIPSRIHDTPSKASEPLSRMERFLPSVVSLRRLIAETLHPVPETVPEGVSFSRDLAKMIGRKGIEIILGACAEYNNLYGSVGVTFDLAPPDEPDLEVSSSGSIAYQWRFLQKNRKDLSFLRTVTLHALTHASAAANARILTPPLLHPNQYMATAVCSGFILELERKDFPKQYNHYINEGVAEALAWQIDPEHMIKGAQAIESYQYDYQPLGILSRQLISEFSDPRQVSQFVRNNDVLAFAREITGSSEATALYQLARWYDLAHNGQPPENIMESIRAYRKQGP